MKKLFGLFALAAIIFVTSCGDDDETSPVTVVSITASGTDLESGNQVEVDLNGASTAVDVPEDAVVNVTFSKELSEASVSETNFLINDVAATVASNGAVVTITPTNGLPRGTDLVLTLGAGIVAEDEGSFVATTRSFKTGGRKEVVPPSASSQNAYWPFNGNAIDETGNYSTSAEIAMTYGEDRFGFQASAAEFDGDASIIEIAEADKLMNGGSFTMSFWMKTNSEGHVNENGDPAAQFVFGLGAFYGFRLEIPSGYNNVSLANRWLIDNGTETVIRNEGFSFDGDGIYNANGGWQGHTFEADLTGAGGIEALIKDRWVHLVFSYDSPTKVATIYADGELMKAQDYNLYGETHPQFNCVGWAYGGEEPLVYPELAFGFIQSRQGELWDAEPWGNYEVATSNHFKGSLDDFRIIHAPYSATQVKELYDAEKP